MDNRMDLNTGWRFKKENEDWEEITIPHTWNGRDGQDGTGMWRGKGIYEREVSFSDEDLKKVLYLEIGAASLVSDVYINHQHVYRNTCPYSMYRVPINPFIKQGVNLFFLEVDNSHNEEVYPHMADFSFYGGLYRSVTIIAEEKIHFDYLDGGRDGVYVSANRLNDKKWNLNIKGTVINEDKDCTVVLNCRLLDSTLR